MHPMSIRYNLEARAYSFALLFGSNVALYRACTDCTCIATSAANEICYICKWQI